VWLGGDALDVLLVGGAAAPNRHLGLVPVSTSPRVCLEFKDFQRRFVDPGTRPRSEWAAKRVARISARSGARYRERVICHARIPPSNPRTGHATLLSHRCLAGGLESKC